MFRNGLRVGFAQSNDEGSNYERMKASPTYPGGDVVSGQIVVVDVEGLDPNAPEGSRAADYKAQFSFRGEPKPAVPVPDAPPIKPR
jgi:hypothetical protein